MLGIPFDTVATHDALDIISEMIASGRPHYAATANVDFVVQASRDVELRRILTEADLVLCDGMPLVWASRLLGNPLPERVAGSDLVPLLLAEAEQKGWRVFFLGGTEQSVSLAAEKVKQRHPLLNLVGAYSPPFMPLLQMDHGEIIERIRAARPDILLVAFGCPKQEKWIRMHYQKTGVPISIGVGATIDFLAGSMRRAPRWMQRSGLEWVFRLLQEPRRLFRRYVTDLLCFGGAIAQQWWQLGSLGKPAPLTGRVVTDSTRGALFEQVRFAERLDAETVRLHEALWSRLSEGDAHLLLDLSQVTFLDSTGMGLLLRLQKQLRARELHLVLVAPTKQVMRTLELMRFNDFFAIAQDRLEARNLVRERRDEQNVVVTLRLGNPLETVAWQGEIIASNAAEVRRMTQLHLDCLPPADLEMRINLEDVRFIDSTGVSLMVGLRKAARQKGVSLRFTGAQPSVRNVLRILKMDQLLLA